MDDDLARLLTFPNVLITITAGSSPRWQGREPRPLPGSRDEGRTVLVRLRGVTGRKERPGLARVSPGRAPGPGSIDGTRKDWHLL